jgi:SAM-dependent methyltransferase
MSYKDIWDKAATSNWRHAILTNSDEASFETAGEHDAQLLLDLYQQHATTALHGVLDFGCGAGRILKPLMIQHEIPRGIAVDISDEMLKLVKTRIPMDESRLLCRRYDSKTINLSGLPSSESIQLAYSWLCLQHMEQAHAFHAIQEIYKVLAPGGLFLATFPNAHHPAYWRCITTHELHPFPLPQAHVRVYTLDFATLMLERAGFTVVSATAGHPDNAGPRSAVSEAELLLVGQRS